MGYIAKNMIFEYIYIYVCVFLKMMLFCPNGHYNGENDDDPLGFRGKLFSAVQRGDPLRIRWAFYGFLRGLI